ncbi:DIS3-like exonuclease 2 isoform X2 [Ricinus communis]|uniref:DIS3-like exonuclease 2 n=1 Tax=Ricinus communis TaxID=3988 RepID=B9RJ60_RICCO|nr:DIS3-like exonuclease 2 isoform X2 [Ricinus communis]EEF48362.1 RNA binding protein, putative [Ricinus communis]|eukprot:XP_002513779.1 DIS3-like exonuclease 2 isoform X2 [Ricinus communis]
MMRSGTEQSSTVVIERTEDGVADKDKEKKKNKRRSNRRSKQNSPNLVNGGGELSQSSRKSKNYTSSVGCFPSGQPDFDAYAFNSMPTMHISEQVEHLLPSDLSIGGQAFSNSCPEPIAGGLCPFDSISNINTRGKIFASHWSIEAIDEALEKGDAFKAVFHVNAHNRLEAYCKIEGVSTDVLISGLAVQNRAVEGDMVVIKVDPLPCWTKMKGSNGPSNSIALAEDCNSAVELSEMASGSCKGKIKVEVDHDFAESGSFSLPQKGIHSEDSSCATEAVHQELNGSTGYNIGIGDHPSASESSNFGSSMGQHEGANAVGRLCTMISSHPTKRPTGRVVAIIERSPRRDAIIGFLNVKQWFYCREACKKDSKKNKNSSSISDREYIQLMPTDPKFPKMMVLASSLPDSIKKRLEGGDATVEMELVAAQIDNWDDESPSPHAHVSRIFGRGSELEPQLSAILYENTICYSDFSPESLSCIPCDSWEVPAEEIRRRKDLRNLCIFTIDPSTATDLDDALSVERLPNGILRVGVHIADVSYFVLPDSALDKEAQARSTSVYLLRGKLPMLPPLLSENLGSLNPGVDRLAFTIFWELNSTGDVTDRWIGRTVIQSCCKLSYQHAQEMVDGVIREEACNTFGNSLPQLYGPFDWSDVIRSVKSLNEISKTLREKRFNDGALQLESSKIGFLFDEYGIPYDSVLCGRKDSDFLVEEFMLLANRTAAEVISRAFPDSALLRRHPAPNMRKLREFEAFCCKHGLQLDSSSSGNFHQSLECIRGKLKDDSVLCGILMSYASRPMQLATYFCSGVMKDNMNDWGHYALAVALYTHFTSPLRRYPDIIVHRTLAAAIEAEELYMRSRRISCKAGMGDKVMRCFTGIYFDKDAAESVEGKEALSAAASKHRIPCTESLANVVAYCNDRKLASRHVKDACDKLYMWALLKRKEVLLSDARVLGLGPRFMSIYIQKLAIERRIYYEEVEGLTVEWLEATSTLVLNLCSYKRAFRRSGSGFYRELDEFAWVVSPCSLKLEADMVGESPKECRIADSDNNGKASQHIDPISESKIDPVVFPITVRLLSTIPVALHAVGGDDRPIEIGVRVFASSYLS